MIKHIDIWYEYSNVFIFTPTIFLIKNPHLANGDHSILKILLSFKELKLIVI